MRRQRKSKCQQTNSKPMPEPSQHNLKPSARRILPSRFDEETKRHQAPGGVEVAIVSARVPALEARPMKAPRRKPGVDDTERQESRRDGTHGVEFPFSSPMVLCFLSPVSAQERTKTIISQKCASHVPFLTAAGRRGNTCFHPFFRLRL